MNTLRLASIALLACLPLAACGGDRDAGTTTGGQTEPTTAIGKAVQKATDEARKHLATENIDVDSDVAGAPKAQISPKGDFLIDGKAVEITDAQRTLLLKHRANIVAIAETGLAIGNQGADLAGKAVGAAISGMFSGEDEKSIEKRIEAEAGKIEAEVTKICGQLPALLSSQNALAASLPAFEPYAKMTQKDVDECDKDGNVNIPGVAHLDLDTTSGDGTSVENTVRAEVQSAVRESIREAVRGDGGKGDDNLTDAAREAEAAGSDTKR